MGIKNGCGDTGGEQEDGGRVGGKPDLYTTMCKIDSWWEAAVSAGAQLGAPAR